MSRAEKKFVIWALFCVLLGYAAVTWMQLHPYDLETFSIIMFCMIMIKLQLIIAMTLTIRDLYLRPFSTPFHRTTWLFFILCTAGIGWISYLIKHAFKPRLNASEQSDAIAQAPVKS